MVEDKYYSLKRKLNDITMKKKLALEEAKSPSHFRSRQRKKEGLNLEMNPSVSASQTTNSIDQLKESNDGRESEEDDKKDEDKIE